MTGLSVPRRVPLPVVIGVLFAGAVTWLALSDPPEEEPEPSPLPAASSAVTADLPPGQQTQVAAPAALVENSAVPLPRQLRNVSPEGVRTPVVTAPIMRVEPSPIYLERLNPPVAPLPEGPIELHRPEVVDAATLKTKAFTVRLAHIKTLELSETCVSRVGGKWPCGVRARTALRGLVRMNRISCEKITEEAPKAMIADCTRGPVNLAAWMVENGWAIPDEGAPENYTTLMNMAKEQKKGQWQSEWLSELPGTAAPPQPLDETLLPPTVGEDGLRPGLDAAAGQPGQRDLDLLNPLGLPQDLGPVSTQ
ncbi:thermonuclease family protein [Roseibium litorale]|uniref:Thermonuclease family protein n=1 Tax=Roseibium litorale TaxID=2803841 RepID=A0ABR9CRX8_9HYPH|nr:thermonuclease family protein [Roseibium litorale]MBD8893155.1 thermonuclease family protein [Roseibium litorale]